MWCSISSHLNAFHSLRTNSPRAIFPLAFPKASDGGIATLTVPFTRLDDDEGRLEEDGGFGCDGLNLWKSAVDGSDDSESSEKAV